MIRWHAKMICGIIMFIVMPICFLLPIKMAVVIKRWGTRGQYVLDLLTCFAGGVFLASYLVFMAPAVRMLIEENLMRPYDIVYPLPDMIIGLGFFGMLFLNKLVKTINDLTTKKELATSNNARDFMTNGKQHNGSLRNENEPFIILPSDTALVDYELRQLQQSEEDTKSPQDDELNEFEPEVNNTSIVLPCNMFTGSSQVMSSGRASHNISLALSRQQSTTEGGSDAGESMTRSIIMMLALSIDSVLEGMTIGLKKTVIEVWAIFIGIIVHESVIAFCLGLQLVRIHKRLLPVVLASVIYTLMNPIGVIVATLVYENYEMDSRVELANGILQALTSGCFIYVIFYEILDGQINQKTPVGKILATLFGYLFLASFAAIPGSSSYQIHNKIQTSDFNDTMILHTIVMT